MDEKGREGIKKKPGDETPPPTYEDSIQITM